MKKSGRKTLSFFPTKKKIDDNDDDEIKNFQKKLHI